MRWFFGAFHRARCRFGVKSHSTKLPIGRGRRLSFIKRNILRSGTGFFCKRAVSLSKIAAETQSQGLHRARSGWSLPKVFFRYLFVGEIITTDRVRKNLLAKPSKILEFHKVSLRAAYSRTTYRPLFQKFTNEEFNCAWQVSGSDEEYQINVVETLSVLLSIYLIRRFAERIHKFLRQNQFTVTEKW